MTKVRVEFTGDIEVSTQGWSDETKLAQIKKQAGDEINNWKFFVKKGGADPIPVNFIKAKVTHIIFDLE